MSRDREYLLDIMESARIAVSHIGDKNIDVFVKDLQCQDAVIRRLEIVGEAARRISEEMRLAHSELPWSDMVKMRNFMIHEYDDIDPNIIYETAKTDLPKLIITIEKILGQM